MEGKCVAGNQHIASIAAIGTPVTERRACEIATHQVYVVIAHASVVLREDYKNAFFLEPAVRDFSFDIRVLHY